MPRPTDGIHEIERRYVWLRNWWAQRCRIGASVPAYVVIEYNLREFFEFAPDLKNGDFYRPIRELPHGASQANP
jgi:hypothetical protein